MFHYRNPSRAINDKIRYIYTYDRRFSLKMRKSFSDAQTIEHLTEKLYAINMHRFDFLDKIDFYRALQALLYILQN